MSEVQLPKGVYIQGKCECVGAAGSGKRMLIKLPVYFIRAKLKVRITDKHI